MSSAVKRGPHDLRIGTWNIGGLSSPPRKYWELKHLWQPLQQPQQWSLPEYLTTWEKQKSYLKSVHLQQRSQLQLLPQLEAELQHLHDENDLSEAYSSRITQLDEQVRKLRAWQHHRTFLYSRAQFLREGQASTRYFHRLYSKRRTQARLRVLQRDDGSIIEDPGDILEEFTGFYENLAREYPFHDRELQSLQKILSQVQPKLQPQHQTLLHSTPSSTEVIDVLKLFPSNKAPGSDAITVEARQAVLCAIRRILQEYCQATGSNINFNKSELVMLGLQRSFPSWAQEFGWKIPSPTEPVRYLGSGSIDYIGGMVDMARENQGLAVAVYYAEGIYCISDVSVCRSRILCKQTLASPMDFNSVDAALEDCLYVTISTQGQTLVLAHDHGSFFYR
ncbi:hypothetical protein R1sor_008146 [Riccia sorocarpa]|uniref:Uncharacterized protein n=1 Tax=Riccia sorocarpa TaxID=122646 RepID=A0ABD3HW54_9MARC